MNALQYLFCILLYGFAIAYLVVISRTRNSVIDCTRCTYYVSENMYTMDNYDIIYVSECMSKCNCYDGSIRDAHKKLINQHINIP